MVFVGGGQAQRARAGTAIGAGLRRRDGRMGATVGHGTSPAEVKRDLRRRFIRRFRQPLKVRGVRRRRHGWPMDDEAYGEIHNKL